MTLRRINADLTPQKFPFNFAELSSTVVYSDQREIAKTTPNGFSGNESEQQASICQAYYMENVIPVARGFTSIHFDKQVDEIPEIAGKINRQYVLRSQGLGVAWLVLTDSSQYIYDSQYKSWTELNLSNTTFEELYVANVKGATYIHIVGSGVYYYDYTLRTITQVEAKGLDIGSMSGMAGVGALVIFWDVTGRIYNSSIYDPMDFVPSLETGAGSTSVLAITSDIVTIESLGDDFIIYCKDNAVSGRSTGDVHFPFVFEEIVGSDGVAIRDHVAADTNSGVHVIWTGSGFQSVTVQQAEYIWPELRDGICRGLNIQLDGLLERPVISYTQQFDIRLQFCTNNFVCISLKTFEDNIFKQAYVYDQSLGRWGRLVVDHEYIIENPIVKVNGAYSYAELESDFVDYGDIEGRDPTLLYRDIESNVTFSAPAAGINFGVVTATGEIFAAAPSESNDFAGDLEGLNAALPRIFLGRYKFTRDEAVHIQQVMMHKLHNGRIVLHGHLYSGAYVSKTEDFYETLEQPNHWAMQCNADSVSIELNGRFTLTDLQLAGIASGSSYAYGVPARKKFYNYINTVPYPPYVVENLIEGSMLEEVKLYRNLFFEYLSSSGELLEASLRESAQSFTAYDILQFSGGLRSVTLVSASMPVSFSGYDRLAYSSTVQSVTLVQTLFPIVLTHTPQDNLQQNSVILSGTLS